MTKERVLSIDFGEKHIGLAISVPELKIPQPLQTIERKNLWKELEKIFSQYKIETVVVGLPLRTDGTETKFTLITRKFAKELSSKFKVPVKLWDERFSTCEAESTLRMLGKQPSRNKEEIDKLAAAIILEDYLETLIPNR